MDTVESALVRSSNDVLQTQYSKSSGVRRVFITPAITLSDTKRSAVYNFSESSNGPD